MPYEQCLRCGHQAAHGRRFIVSVSITPDADPAAEDEHPARWARPEAAEGSSGPSLAEVEELAFFLCARCKSRFVADPGGQDPDVPWAEGSDQPQVLH